MNTQESKRRKVCENASNLRHEISVPFDVESSPYVKFKMLQIPSVDGPASSNELGSYQLQIGYVTRFVPQVDLKLEYERREYQVRDEGEVVWIKLVQGNDKVRLTMTEDFIVSKNGYEELVKKRLTYVVDLFHFEDGSIRVGDFWYRMTVPLGSRTISFKFQLCNIGEDLQTKYPMYVLFSPHYQYDPLLLITFDFLDSKFLIQTIRFVSAHFRRLVTNRVDLRWMPTDRKVKVSEAFPFFRLFRIVRSEIYIAKLYTQIPEGYTTWYAAEPRVVTEKNKHLCWLPELPREVLSNTIRILDVHVQKGSVGLISLTNICENFPRMESLSVYGEESWWADVKFGVKKKRALCLKHLNLILGHKPKRGFGRVRTIQPYRKRPEKKIFHKIIQIFETFPNLEYYCGPDIIMKPIRTQDLVKEGLNSASIDELKPLKAILEKKMKLEEWKDNWGDRIQIGNPIMQQDQDPSSRFLERSVVFIYRGLFFRIGWSEEKSKVSCFMVRTPMWKRPNAAKVSIEITRKKRRSGWKHDQDCVSMTKTNRWLMERDYGNKPPKGLFFDIFDGEDLEHNDYEIYFRAKVHKFCSRREGEWRAESEKS